MPARLGSEQTEPVLLVVEGDPLDKAGQDFLRRAWRIGIHLQPIFGARAASAMADSTANGSSA